MGDRAQIVSEPEPARADEPALAEAHAQIVAEIEPQGLVRNLGRWRAARGCASLERECEQVPPSRGCKRELQPWPRVDFDQEHLTRVLVAQDLDFRDSVVVE